MQTHTVEPVVVCIRPVCIPRCIRIALQKIRLECQLGFSIQRQVVNLNITGYVPLPNLNPMLVLADDFYLATFSQDCAGGVGVHLFIEIGVLLAFIRYNGSSGQNTVRVLLHQLNKHLRDVHHFDTFAQIDDTLQIAHTIVFTHTTEAFVAPDAAGNRYRYVRTIQRPGICRIIVEGVYRNAAIGIAIQNCRMAVLEGQQGAVNFVAQRQLQGEFRFSCFGFDGQCRAGQDAQHQHHNQQQCAVFLVTRVQHMENPPFRPFQTSLKAGTEGGLPQARLG